MHNVYLSIERQNTNTLYSYKSYYPSYTSFYRVRNQVKRNALIEVFLEDTSQNYYDPSTFEYQFLLILTKDSFLKKANYDYFS